MKRCLVCTTLVPPGQSRCALHAIQRLRGRANQRRRLALVVGQRCARCGAPASELDHVRPLAHGGNEGTRNLQPLCHRCHAAKTAAEGRGGRIFQRSARSAHTAAVSKLRAQHRSVFLRP